jgi:hypothetical protein
MKESVKIAFIWPWPQAKSVYPKWRDGLRRALELIGERYQVDWFFEEDYKDKDLTGYQAILVWADSQDLVVDHLPSRVRKGLILTTMPYDIDNLRKYQIIFCESKPVLREVQKHGLYGIHAFGTDDEFYKPNGTQKDILYFYPATFSPWKRQRDIANLKGGLWCIGTVQPDGQEDLQACIANGVHVMEGYFSPDVVREYYDRAEFVVIPAVHGSERTVLEAMSMNLLPQVTPSNHKAY